jgi:hypothetical protein
VKSTELYRYLREDLGSWFRANGFKRAQRTQLGWQQDRLLVWFQCDQWGWDRYAGSSFFVNFQTSGQPAPWAGPTERLQHFLDPDELEAARELQNAVIRKLSPPPRDVEALRAGFARLSKDPDGLVDALLAAFRPVVGPCRADQDFSLRYFDREDVRGWAAFLLRLLPRIVDGLLSRDGVPRGEGDSAVSDPPRSPKSKPRPRDTGGE